MSTDITTPHENDVLFGRGNGANKHPGNLRFRQLVKEKKLQYVLSPKPQRPRYPHLIIDAVRRLDPPGRFLKRDPKSELWYEVDEMKAVEKARQALSEGAPVFQALVTGLRKKLKVPSVPGIKSKKMKKAENDKKRKQALVRQAELPTVTTGMMSDLMSGLERSTLRDGPGQNGSMFDRSTFDKAIVERISTWERPQSTSIMDRQSILERTCSSVHVNNPSVFENFPEEQEDQDTNEGAGGGGLLLPQQALSSASAAVASAAHDTQRYCQRSILEQMARLENHAEDCQEPLDGSGDEDEEDEDEIKSEIGMVPSDIIDLTSTDEIPTGFLLCDVFDDENSSKGGGGGGGSIRIVRGTGPPPLSLEETRSNIPEEVKSRCSSWRADSELTGSCQSADFKVDLEEMEKWIRDAADEINAENYESCVLEDDDNEEGAGEVYVIANINGDVGRRVDGAGGPPRKRIRLVSTGMVSLLGALSGIMI